MHKGTEDVFFTRLPLKITTASPLVGRCDALAPHAGHSAEAHPAIDFVLFDILAKTTSRASNIFQDLFTFLLSIREGWFA